MIIRLFVSLVVAVVVALASVLPSDCQMEFGGSSIPMCPVSKGPEPLVFQAPFLELGGDWVRASGGVDFSRSNVRVSASELDYSLSTESGKLSDVSFTTCNKDHSHYSIKARSLTLSGDRMRASGVSIYLGRTRLLGLPSLLLNTSSGRSARQVFPKPGFDSEYGLTLAQELRFIDNSRAKTRANVRLSNRHGVSGEIESLYGADGPLIEYPGRFLAYYSMRQYAMTMPQDPINAPCDPQLLRPAKAARMVSYWLFTIEEPAYDIINKSLRVFRQPDLGMRFVAPSINPYKTKLDPRIEIYPEIITSWGRFKESPGIVNYTTRRNATIVAAINAFPLGSSTAIQPAILQSFSRYGTGDYYHNWAYAVDVSHINDNRTYVSARYIKRNENGITPFQFDNVDILEECQVACQFRTKSRVYGFVGSYNFETSKIYEWELLYGVRTDCLTAWLHWNNRIHRLSFDVALAKL